MQPVTILIADDNATVRNCLRRAVETDPQMQIRWEADDGLKALLLARQHGPQIILMAAQMPRMDGFEVTRCLRQRNCRVRIIVMSVYEQMRDQALAAGADDFVTLDSGCDTIRNTILRVLNRD